jgi:hypothetical protein
MSFSPALAPNFSLSSSEGDLVSIAICVEPRRLETLLETLARVGFPINPQICHEAVIAFPRADEREETAVTTLVEFPAYLGRLEEVYRALESEGFERDAVQSTSMLEELRSGNSSAPHGSGPRWVVRSRKPLPGPSH